MEIRYIGRTVPMSIPLLVGTLQYARDMVDVRIQDSPLIHFKGEILTFKLFDDEKIYFHGPNLFYYILVNKKVC